MYRWLVPWVILPLAEHLGGRRMWTETRRLRELQWRSHSELEARGLTRLRALLAHAAMHVPYYHDLFKQAGIQPEDVRTLTDLAAVPLTTKADLRRNFPTRTTAHDLPEHRQRKMMTSGSTGLPFELYWDRSCADVLLGTYLFLLEWAGAAIWDTQVAIVSPSYFYAHLLDSSRFRQAARRLLLGERTVRLSATAPTVPEFRMSVLPALRNGQYFIRGYPSSIAHLAAQLVTEGVDLPKYPEVVIVYAETLTEASRARIGRTFRCRVVNYYSSWEVPQMAQTCPDNGEVLHVISERVILQVVREDGTLAPPGESGRVVVTDLSNYVMPFINYAIGDYAVAAPPCPCGRGFPTLKRLEGRDTEVIQTPGGKHINGGVLGQFLTFVIDVIPFIWEYQAVQHAPDALTLRVVPTAQYTSEFARMLQGKLEAFLEPGLNITVEPVDHIPREPSGKRLIIKSLLT
jgi:phenylacetate-CoA ligase